MHNWYLQKQHNSSDNRTTYSIVGISDTRYPHSIEHGVFECIWTNNYVWRKLFVCILLERKLVGCRYSIQSKHTGVNGSIGKSLFTLQFVLCTAHCTDTLTRRANSSFVSNENNYEYVQHFDKRTECFHRIWWM